jgi:hypothetical protein
VELLLIHPTIIDFVDDDDDVSSLLRDPFGIAETNNGIDDSS